MTLIAVLLCSSVLFMTAYAAVQNVSSYETLKSALLNYNAYDNGTLRLDAKVSENGKEIVLANLVDKLETKYTSSTVASVTVNGVTKTYGAWENKEQTIQIDYDSDKYLVHPSVHYDNYYSSYHKNLIGYSSEDWESLTSAQQKLVNAVIDLAVGDVKNYFISSGKTISLNINKNQIPQIVQLLLAYNFEQMPDRDYIYLYDVNDIRNIIPIFIINTEIDSANMAITLADNNQITGCELAVIIKGTDTQGISHKFVYEMNLSITDFGTTKADTVDLNDKNIIVD